MSTIVRYFILVLSGCKDALDYDRAPYRRTLFYGNIFW